MSNLYFWVRENKTPTAEVDFLIPYEGKVIPIETKSGKTGTLKSLHQYLDLAPHKMAVRFYSGDISISEVKTGQKNILFIESTLLSSVANQ